MFHTLGEALKIFVEPVVVRFAQALFFLMVLSLRFRLTITSTMASTLLDQEV